MNPSIPDHLQKLISSQVSASMNSKLEEIPSPTEIKEAIMGMGAFKSPGPDGMSVAFYKSYWNTVGVDVIREVQAIFKGGRLKTPHNHTFLALVPKTDAASRVEHYRPIALCNVFYKTITKIISTRLRPVLCELIHPAQSAFIPNRAIGDNTIINHEVMNYLHKKKGKGGYMAIKIDLAKAYDRVEWAVLRCILLKLGFSAKFTELIMECVSTTSFSVMLNGTPFGLFKGGRGLR